MNEPDPSTQQIANDFDAYAKKRCAELMTTTANAPLQATREVAFCMGYKAGVIDLGAALRPFPNLSHLEAIYAAALAWRIADTDGELPAVYEQRLIAAIDAARKEVP